MADGTVTLTEAKAILDEYITAERKLSLTGVQSYAMGDVTLTRANIPEIRAQITHWRAAVKDLEASASAGAGDYAYANPHVAVARIRR